MKHRLISNIENTLFIMRELGFITQEDVKEIAEIVSKRVLKKS